MDVLQCQKFISYQFSTLSEEGLQCNKNEIGFQSLQDTKFTINIDLIIYRIPSYTVFRKH